MKKLLIKKLIDAQKAFVKKYDPNEASNCRSCLFYPDFLRSISPEASELYDSYDFTDSNGDRWNGCSLAAKVYNELFGLNIKINEITVNGRTVHKLFCADIKIYEKYDIRTFKLIQFRKIKI